MVFIETSVFTSRLKTALTDDEYRSLQADLIIDPGAGDLIKGSKGLRKIRVRSKGKGKRGGARIIYYWFVSDQQIYFLYLYNKSDAGDLTRDQIKILSQIVDEEFYERKRVQ